MDELEILIQAILSLKDVTKSKQQIKSELPKLEQQLQSDKSARVKIVAGLDINKSKSLIESQLSTLSSKIKVPTIKIGVGNGNFNNQNIGKSIINELHQIPNVSKKVSNEMVRNFRDTFGIAKRLSQEAKSEIKSTLQEISDSWNNGDIDKYSKSIEKIMGLASKNGIQIINPETQNIIQQLKDFLTDGSKVYITKEIREDLLHSLGTVNEMKSVLSSVFGVGGWTFDKSKNSTSVETVADENQVKQYHDIANTILEIGNNIKTLKNASKGTVFDEMSTQMANNEIEDLIRSILKLENETSKLTYISGVGIFENIDSMPDIKVDIDPEKEKELNQFLKKEVELLNQIFNTKAKIAKIKDDPNKSVELETQNSILSKHREDLATLHSENLELSKLVSQQKQNKYIVENTSKARQNLKVAEAQAADKLAKSEKELVQQSEKNLATEIKKSAQLERQVDTLKSQIATYKSSNPRAVKYYDKELDSLLQDLAFAETPEDVSKVRTEFTTLKAEIRAAGKEGKTFWQTIKDGAEKFSSWMTLTSIISAVARDIKKMVTNVIELDSVMTNLKKVTDETGSTYERFLKNTAQQAKELHSTMTDLIEQTSTWAKLGYNLSESNTLAKASMIYSNVGEVDNEQAVTNIVSALKAFDIAAEDVMKIPDVYNKLGNEFAISSKNLGSGMAQAATTMAMAGNDFNQVAAILTGAGEVLGDNKMDEIGNGMKTVTLRIQNQAGALKELGEEYEDLVSVSKTQQQIFELTNGKVNIMQDADPNSFRATYDILEDISQVIQELNDTQASELIQLLFGKNRANVGTAVLKAFQSGQIQKAYQAAEDSVGSAQAEFDKWSESIEAHLNTLSSSFESLSNTVVNSDLIKGGIDFLTEGLNLLDSIIDKFGTIQTLISTIALGTSLKNVGELYQTRPLMHCR